MNIKNSKTKGLFDISVSSSILLLGVALASFQVKAAAEDSVGQSLEKPEIAERCATCHTNAGVSPMPGWPPISGMKKDDIVHKLKGYRSNRVPDSVMSDTTHDLSDEQIEALAEYYSLQPLIDTE